RRPSQSSALGNAMFRLEAPFHLASALRCTGYPARPQIAHFLSYAHVPPAAPASSRQNRRRRPASVRPRLSLLLFWHAPYAPPAKEIPRYAKTTGYAFPNALHWPID